MEDETPPMYSHWVVIPGSEVMKGDILIGGTVVEKPEQWVDAPWILVQLAVADEDNSRSVAS